MSDEKAIPSYIRFLIGGVGGMGTSCFTHPLDLLKTRMQLSGMGSHAREHKTTFHAIKHVIEREGILALYDGLSASLIRQATYTSARVGVYSTLIDLLTKSDGTPPGFTVKLVCGMLGGVAGAIVGTPADVALIRMAADGRLPVAERRNYKSVTNAWFRMAKEEGILTLWRGTIPSTTRAVVVNLSQVVTYNQIKENLLHSGHFRDDLKCHFVSSMVSGIVTVVASLPIDMAKTRLQNMKVIDNKPEYTGMVDVMTKVVKKEGVLALWKGITPTYMRVGPHTVIFFIFMEQLTNLYKYYVLNQRK